MKRMILCAASVATFMAAPAAHAATKVVNVPDVGPPGFILNDYGDASVTYDGVAFSQSAALSNGVFFTIGSNFVGASLPAVSSQQQTVGLSNILISLPELASSITINFGTFYGNSVTFALSNGVSSVLSSTMVISYATPNVYSSGMTSPFSSVQLTSPDYVLNVSSIAYTTIDAVPEPATWAMMLIGLAMTGVALRRRKCVKVRYAF